MTERIEIIEEVTVVEVDETHVEVIEVAVQGPAGVPGAPGADGAPGPQGLPGIQGPAGDPATNLVTSVAGKQGTVTLSKADVGLGSVDNTPDTAKPVSTAQQVALDGKVDKISTANRLYGTAAAGVEATLGYSQQASVNTVAQRFTDGRLKGGTAVANDDLVNKAQLDAGLAQQLSIADPRTPLRGTGFPNGVISAPVGSIYIDTAVSNGVGSWIKRTGTSNTGWNSNESEWQKVLDVSLATVATTGIYTGSFPTGYSSVKIIVSGSIGSAPARDIQLALFSGATLQTTQYKIYYDSSGTRVSAAASGDYIGVAAGVSTGTTFEISAEWRFSGNGSWNGFKSTSTRYSGVSSLYEEFIGYTAGSARPTTFELSQSLAGTINNGAKVTVYVK